MLDFDPEATEMTLEEVANYLKLSRTKLYELAQGGRYGARKSPGVGALVALRVTKRCSRSTLALPTARRMTVSRARKVAT